MPTLSLAPMLTVMPVRTRKPTRTRCECGRRWEILTQPEFKDGRARLQGLGCSTCKVWKPAFPETPKPRRKRPVHIDGAWWSFRIETLRGGVDEKSPWFRPRQFLMWDYEKRVQGMEARKAYCFCMILKTSKSIVDPKTGKITTRGGRWGCRYTTVQNKDGYFRYSARVNARARYPWVTTIPVRGQRLDLALFNIEEMMVFAASWAMWMHLVSMCLTTQIKGAKHDAYQFAADQVDRFREWLRDPEQQKQFEQDKKIEWSRNNF